LNGKKVLIRFQETPYRDSQNRPYKPLIRGLCYIHPTKDTGMSGGKYCRELQVALNDTINISNDRVRLATMPFFKGRRFSIEENDEIYIEPEHVIPLEDINDLQEFQIRDNVSGAMNQAQMFRDGMQQVESIYPTTMGQLPDSSSTTATAIAGAESRTNIRANYKSLTFEHTFLAELYWMIIQMSFQFMDEEMAKTIFTREEVEAFDPDGDYVYQPVSSNIEQEFSKIRKLNIIDQAMGRLANVPNPNTPKLLNKLMMKFFELLGSEYNDIKDSLLDEGPVGQMGQMGMMGGGAQTGTAESGMAAMMPSNQYGNEVSPQQMAVRMQ